MKIAICDDEEKYREIGRWLCSQYFLDKRISFEVIEFSSGEAVIEYTEKIDLIILDIEMQGMNGIEVKEILTKRNSNGAIIYVTNHEELMQPAFGKNVYGFLLKPIYEEELYQILDVVYKNRMEPRLIQVTDSVWVRSTEIRYIFAEDKYCRIYTMDTNYLIRSRISDWEGKLPGSDFIRVQKSCIVNFKFIRRIGQDIIMEDNTVLTYSRNKREVIKNNYNTYLIEHAW
ncbi:MAG TPA: response regulator transcription factor [Clostridiales bacterium]|nr:response regulator transcription factor [Clostridiales bacterium]